MSQTIPCFFDPLVNENHKRYGSKNLFAGTWIAQDVPKKI